MLRILVNSNTVAMFLLKVLSAEQNAELVELRAADPLSSLYGSAKTFLGVKNEPVVVLLDANSSDQNVADRLRESAEEVIGEVAGAAPLRILVAVPAVESLLFERSDAVKRAFPHATDTDIEIGKLSPASALSRLDPSGSPPSATVAVLRQLNEEDVAAIRGLSPVKELLAFLAELRRDGIVSAVARV